MTFGGPGWLCKALILITVFDLHHFVTAALIAPGKPLWAHCSDWYERWPFKDLPGVTLEYTIEFVAS